MSSPRDPGMYLLDMAEACGLIREFATGRTFADYEADVLLRSAIERQFQILGEALVLLNRYAPNTAARIDDVRQIINFRNQIVHGYRSMQNRVVWDIIGARLPELRIQLDALLDEIDDG